MLVIPLKTQNKRLAEKYRDILLFSEELTTYEITHEISERASELRAEYSIRTPDAIQIAVGLIYSADVFLTNDSDLKKVNKLKVLTLDEFLIN